MWPLSPGPTPTVQSHSSLLAHFPVKEITSKEVEERDFPTKVYNKCVESSPPGLPRKDAFSQWEVAQASPSCQPSIRIEGDWGEGGEILLPSLSSRIFHLNPHIPIISSTFFHRVETLFHRSTGSLFLGLC